MKRLETVETEALHAVSGTVATQVNEVISTSSALTQPVDRVARPRILERRIARAERRATR